MKNIFTKITLLLTKAEKNRMYLLFIINLMVAFLDLAGVAAIMPFISLLANPEMIKNNIILMYIYDFFKFSNTKQFIYFFGFFVFFLLVLSVISKALILYLQTNFVLLREFTIGKRMVEGYLNQTYSWFLNKNSSDIGKTILSEINNVIMNCIMPLMFIVSQSFIVIALISLLIIADPKLALIVGLILFVTYFIISKLMNGYLSIIGKNRIEANKDRFLAVSEAFGGIKEVKINGLESYYINRFSKPAEIYARNQASAQIISLFPRYLIEGIAFGLMLLIPLYLYSRGENLIDILPIITMYAFAAYRLLPATQQIYAGFSQLKFSSPALEVLYSEIINLKRPTETTNNFKIIPLNNFICLENVTYSYPNSSKLILENVNLKIKAYSTIGFVGSTGSGKTTTVDIILGLLEPNMGNLKIDGIIINELNRKDWQNSIGYVPQQIYLSDDTIQANIAFGIKEDLVDYNDIVRAAKIANLHDFVINDLPLGYKTELGERGVRLSGGQRQRIGIARALYKNPQILVLDEATSALDNLTENSVMEAINNITKEITIIMVAHRLSTVQKCDVIFYLEDGKVKHQGTYKELESKVDLFKTMNKK
jgi:ABC-type multidrug transport system fused ATPase/permease subunit